MIKSWISSILTVVCLFFTSIPSYPQKAIIIPKNAYGLEIVKSKFLFDETIKEDSNQLMISLSSYIPLLVLDLRYSSTNNFMHRIMYSSKTKDTYLRLPAARALLKAQRELNTKGYGLKIFDAYRPYSVTE